MMGLFVAAHRCWGSKSPSSSAKVCYTGPTMIKLGTSIPYLKKMQKYKNHVTHSSSSADISFFFHQKLIVLLYKEMQVKNGFYHVFSNSFDVLSPYRLS